MRRKLIAGNWKMNCLKSDGVALAAAVAEKCTENLPFDVLICPPISLLATISGDHKNMAVGAQDVAETNKEFGAFTGDVSAKMLTDLGVTHTLVGHSERRTLHHETDAVVRAKAENALSAGLTPVICIGETEAERDAGKTLDVVRTQLQGSVPTNVTAENCVIAYEPVWAIGTGKVPTNDDVAEVHAEIRAELERLLGADVAAGMRVLYGGSVKPSNASELLAIDNVDGVLIGGASLKIDDFWGIASTQL